MVHLVTFLGVFTHTVNSGQMNCNFMNNLSLFLFCPQTYSQLAHPIQQAKGLGLRFQSKILDIDNIDVGVSQ